MQPIAPLMIEHRLIERMIHLIEMEKTEMEEYDKIDFGFIDVAVDFIRTYADRTHHGKEEDILFRDLENKNLSRGDRKLKNDLIEEHKYARKLVGDLVEAKKRYVEGHKESLTRILEKLQALVDFYPEHIRKEDRTFFRAAMEYLNKTEQDAMLQECWEFDRKMIHEKYRLMVEDLEKTGEGRKQTGKGEYRES